MIVQSLSIRMSISSLDLWHKTWRYHELSTSFGCKMNEIYRWPGRLHDIALLLTNNRCSVYWLWLHLKIHILRLATSAFTFIVYHTSEARWASHNECCEIILYDPKVQRQICVFLAMERRVYLITTVKIGALNFSSFRKGNGNMP